MIKELAYLTALLFVVDAATTVTLLKWAFEKHGYKGEKNPISRILFKAIGILPGMLLKTFTKVLALGWAVDFATKHHPAFGGYIPLGILFALFVFVAQNNIRVWIKVKP